MMPIEHFTAFLGRDVIFFLPSSVSKVLDNLFYPVFGVVTAVNIDLNPNNNSFCLDDGDFYFFRDCIFVDVLENPLSAFNA